MNASPYFQTELRHLLDHDQGAGDSARRRVECGEEAVAGRVHLAPTEPLELAANQLVVLLEQVAPRSISQLRRAARRFDDVREKHRGQVAVSTASRARHQLCPAPAASPARAHCSSCCALPPLTPTGPTAATIRRAADKVRPTDCDAVNVLMPAARSLR